MVAVHQCRCPGSTGQFRRAHLPRRDRRTCQMGQLPGGPGGRICISEEEHVNRYEEAYARAIDEGKSTFEALRIKHLVQRRHRLAEGKCALCDRDRNDLMAPWHDPSVRCESGCREHCTCDVCF